MTVSTTIIKNLYPGTGSQSNFVYAFKIIIDSDLEVIIRTNATGAESLPKTLGTDYSMTGAGAAGGGVVTFLSGKIPTNVQTVVLRRNVPKTQAIDYIANDPFPAETHEEGLDRGIMVAQQNFEEVERSIKLSKTNTMTSTEFKVGATERAGKILAFDASGELAVTQELGSFKGNSATTTTAAFNIRDIVKSTTTAQLNNIYICIKASPIGTALTNTTFWVLIVDAVSAAASAAAAVVAKDAAVVAKNESVAAKDLSVTAKNESVTAKNTSVAAKDLSVTAKNAAEAAFDSFDDRYLGAKSSNPSTDNDGNALITGALYFNSGTSQIFNWTAADAWEAIKPTSTEQGKINTVAADATDIGAVAGKSNEIGRLGTSAAVADLAILGTDAIVADMAILGTDAIVADMAILGSNAVVADMAILGSNAVVADMAILGTNDVVADMNVLGTSDVVTDMNVLGTSNNVTAMNTLGTSTNVTNMATVAANVAGVNSFAERYRVASSDPSNSLNEGDLVFNTQDNNLKFYNGTAWVSIAPGIANVVDDSTPQLGGNLDTNQRQINTVSNRNILLAPNGTGVVEVRGNNNGGTIQLNCEQNTHGVKIKSPPHSAGQSYTLTLPSSISNGQFLKTDGSGNLSFAAVTFPVSPTVANVSQTIAPSSATTINITGTNFSSIPTVEFIKSNTGAITSANTVSLTNATTLAVNVTLASGSYFVRVELDSGNAGRSANAIISASTAPAFQTNAGSIGTYAGNFSGELFDIQGSSDSAVAFSEVTSVLSGAGISLNTSNGKLTTSDFGGSSTTPTTYTFTLRLTDQEAQTTDRQFTITSSFGATGGGQFN